MGIMVVNGNEGLIWWRWHQEFSLAQGYLVDPLCMNHESFFLAYPSLGQHLYFDMYSICVWWHIEYTCGLIFFGEASFTHFCALMHDKGSKSFFSQAFLLRKR
jgi:hypothetical protein